MVELPLGQPDISLTVQGKPKKTSVSSLVLSLGKKFLGTIHLLVPWLDDVFQLFVMLKANPSNLSQGTQKKLISN